MGNNPQTDYVPLLRDESDIGLDDEKLSTGEFNALLSSSKNRRTILFYRALVGLEALAIFALLLLNRTVYVKYNQATCSQVTYCESPK